MRSWLPAAPRYDARSGTKGDGLDGLGRRTHGEAEGKDERESRLHLFFVLGAEQFVDSVTFKSRVIAKRRTLEILNSEIARF